MHQEKPTDTSIEGTINRSIRYYYRRLEESLQQWDQYLTHHTLDTVLTKPIEYEQEWLKQALLICRRQSFHT